MWPLGLVAEDSEKVSAVLVYWGLCLASCAESNEFILPPTTSALCLHPPPGHHLFAQGLQQPVDHQEI